MRSRARRTCNAAASTWRACGERRWRVVRVVPAAHTTGMLLRGRWARPSQQQEHAQEQQEEVEATRARRRESDLLCGGCRLQLPFPGQLLMDFPQVEWVFSAYLGQNFPRLRRASGAPRCSPPQNPDPPFTEHPRRSAKGGRHPGVLCVCAPRVSFGPLRPLCAPR